MINSKPASLEIAEYTTDNVFVADKYSVSDFSTDRFIYAPVGTSVLTVSHEGEGDIRATIEVVTLYETV